MQLSGSPCLKYMSISQDYEVILMFSGHRDGLTSSARYYRVRPAA